MKNGAIAMAALTVLSWPRAATAGLVRVPEDQPSIPDAVLAASAGDTILVAPGRWCGAIVSKRLYLEGDGEATIVGCPTSPRITQGPYSYRIGLALTAAATGSVIHGFTFDGAGFTDVFTPEMLAIGITSRAAEDVSVLENVFLGGLIGVNDLTSGWVIGHNVFSGFTLSRSGLGGLAINASNPYGGTARRTGTRIEFNDMDATVPSGDWSDYRLIAELDLPFAGVFLEGQDGAVVSYNHVAIRPNERGEPGAGIVATDEVTGISDVNVEIAHDDGRECAYVVIATGTGQNTAGATIEKNLGTSLVDGAVSTFGGPR